MVAAESDRQAESLVGLLISRGWNFVWERQNDRQRIASVRLQGPGRGEVLVDLLLGLSGIEDEVVASAEPIVLGHSIELPVASLPSLIALKILAGRDKDSQDTQALLAAASELEILQARALLDLIERRGFDREKDLQRELDLRLLGMGSRS